MGHSEELSKSTERGWSSETLFRRARRGASSALSDGGESPARSATPQNLKSACALLCKTGELYEALLISGGGEHGAGDLGPYNAPVKRPQEALLALSRRPATTMGEVLAKVAVVLHLSAGQGHDAALGWINCASPLSETEAGLLATELVRDLASAIGGGRHDWHQATLRPDSELARGCAEFFIADRAYEQVVCGSQANLSGITTARQRRANALAVVMSFHATTIGEFVAQAEVVLHLSESRGHDATALGRIALMAIDELTSLAEAA
jgi:hypothetical protein